MYPPSLDDEMASCSVTKDMVKCSQKKLFRQPITMKYSNVVYEKYNSIACIVTWSSSLKRKFEKLNALSVFETPRYRSRQREGEDIEKSLDAGCGEGKSLHSEKEDVNDDQRKRTFRQHQPSSSEPSTCQPSSNNESIKTPTRCG